MDDKKLILINFMNKKEIKVEKDKIKDKLRANKSQLINLIYENEHSYPWSKTAAIIRFANEFAQGIPSGLWPEMDADSPLKIKSGNWTVSLDWVDQKQTIDFRYNKDDHTAWLIRGKNGKFKDFDIGGS